MRFRNLVAATAALVVPLAGVAVVGGTGGIAQAASKSATGPTTPKPAPLKTKTDVTIGIPVAVENFAALIVGQKMGEFAKTNLTVTLIVDPGGTNSEPQELATGLVQAVNTGINASALNAMYDKIPEVYVGNPDFPNPQTKAGFWVAKTFLNADGTFNKAKAATFKMSLGTAGVSSSGAAEVQAWLQKSHESIATLTQETLAAAPMVQALQSGAIGGGFVNAPYWTPLATTAKFVDVASPPYATGVLAMYKPWANSHKAIAEAIIRSLVRVDRTELAPGYRTNAAVMSIISTWLKIPVATIKLSTPIVFSPTYSLTISPPGATKTPNSIKVITEEQAGWIQIGSILQYTKPRPAKDFIDSTFQKAAIKS